MKLKSLSKFIQYFLTTMFFIIVFGYISERIDYILDASASILKFLHKIYLPFLGISLGAWLFNINFRINQIENNSEQIVNALSKLEEINDQLIRISNQLYYQFNGERPNENDDDDEDYF